MHTVTESIFRNDYIIIPLEEVLFIEKIAGGIIIVFKSTTWNKENDYWENSAFIHKVDSRDFIQAWCRYRAEIEADNLVKFP